MTVLWVTAAVTNEFPTIRVNKQRLHSAKSAVKSIEMCRQ